VKIGPYSVACTLPTIGGEIKQLGGVISVNRRAGGSQPPPYPFPFLPFLFPPLFPLPVPSHPLRSRTPEIQLGSLGERCKLPQRGLGWSPSRNRIWHICVKKCDIWWQQF